MKKLRFENGTECLSAGREIARATPQRKRDRSEMKALALLAIVMLAADLLQWGLR